MSSKKAKPATTTSLGKRLSDDVSGGSDASASRRAKYEMRFEQPATKVMPQRAANTGGPTITCKAVVLRSKNGSIRRADGQNVPKIDYVFAVTSVSGQAPDMLSGGKPGFSFLIPTTRPPKKSDVAGDSPEGGGAGGKATAPGRQLDIADANHKTCWLGLLYCSNFVKDGTPLGPDGMPQKFEPGSVVTVTGVVANFGVGDNATNLFINSAAPTGEEGPIQAGHAPGMIKQAFLTPECAMMSAVLHSSSMNGFFDMTFDTEAEQASADSIKETWMQGVANLISSCESKASALRSEGGNSKQLMAATALEEHASRLRGTPASEVASGTRRLFLPARNPGENDPPTMQYAPLVQWGKSPMNKIFPEMTGKVLDGEYKGLPSTFCEMSIVQVEIPEDKYLAHAFARLFFVVDAQKTAEASLKDEDPGFIGSQDPVIGFKMSLREMGPLVFNTMMKGKTIMAMRELLPVANMSAVVAVTPHAVTDSIINDYYPMHQCIDMRTTLLSSGVAVSEKFAMDQLAGEGVSQFIFDINEVTGEKITPKDDEHPLPPQSQWPSLVKDGYVCCSDNTFKFTKAKMPPHLQKREYRVVFDGSVELLGTTQWATAVSDAERGQALIWDVVCKKDVELDVFMKEHALVYCVAVP